MTIVNQTEIDDVYRNFGVVAGPQLIPDFFFEIFLGNRRAGGGRFRSGLAANGIGIFAFDSEHVAIDDDRVAAAEGLGDLSLLAFLQRNLVANRNHGSIDITGQSY